LELKIPPPLIGLGTAALMWLAARALPGLAFALPGRTTFAAVLAAAGLLVDVAGILSFMRARTTVNPLKPASASTLVTAGIYRFTRNPMYLGMLLLLLGWAVYLANIASFIVVPIYVLYLNRFQIGPEERALASLFGERYAGYKLQVRRWL
jgi:protein-S-isoprenylcysteine O-methyltransferase Ste14